MPAHHVRLDPADAIELGELLTFLDAWLDGNDSTARHFAPPLRGHHRIRPQRVAHRPGALHIPARQRRRPTALRPRQALNDTWTPHPRGQNW